ncbi:YcnI family protein [Staphylococcus equorum]|uniref:YcnI family protein n=1 Tax=Staphylococcus equorum TaxID=246432 RepID=A0A9X4LC72_9STAP|nr:YcnI family protein [Staphylococcus equorum]MDG0844023.1 YcnI family protein [Staphylococcus equorum]MDG0859952.1 YcnI family protein [Staphylococcus equorum]
MLKQILTAIVVCIVAVSFSKSAEAHVTLNPDTSEPGSYEKYDVRIPVEKDANTTKIELKVPKALTVVGVEPNDQFEHKLTKDDDGNITKITWTAKDKGIGPNEFIDLAIQVANPEKEGEFKWDAYQTYDDGDTVRWTGDKDAEKPAPITKVAKGSADTAGSSQSSNGPIALWIVSIVAIILSLVAIFKKTAK